MQSQLPAKLSGTVTRFKGDGRKLGYPTANLKLGTDLDDGVYFGFADLAKWKDHPAIIFIGTPETLGSDGRRVEAHLLDIPDEDYYDQKLKLRIEHFHRPNHKFPSVEELKKVMHADETAARHWFAND